MCVCVSVRVCSVPTGNYRLCRGDFFYPACDQANTENIQILDPGPDFLVGSESFHKLRSGFCIQVMDPFLVESSQTDPE